MIQDLILSYEAVQAKDGSYNFAKGAFNNYPFVGRLLSGKQKSIEYPEITITEQYELKLNQKQLDQLLIDGIKDSENFKMDSFYNTVDFNCATKAFALLDNLPDLLVKEPESFLTVLSNDPVAGPSIKALKDRNLLVRRVSNLRDELEKGEYKELEMPKSPSLGLLTELEDKEYSVVFFSETENMVENQTDLIKNAEKEAYTILPMLMQAIISASMDTQEDTLATLNSALKTVKSKIGHSINYLDNMAGESPVNVTMFFVPWDKFMGGEKINPLSHLDVKAALPFDSYKIQSRSDLFLASLNMYEIQEHLRNNPSEKRPFAPLGFNVSLHLEKGKTTITLQNVTHIQELQKEFSFSNPQVNFNQIVVPKGEALDPALFLTLKQTVSQKPRLLFEFAGFEGIYGDNPEFRFDLENLGQFYKSRSFASSLHNRPGSCKVQAAYTPRLVGKFGPKAHENGIINYILKDRGVEFQIFAIEMDLENDFQIKNSNINVSVESLGFRCITQEDVNTQFTDAGNQQLLDLKKHFQVDTEGTQPLIKMLGHFLKGNTENVVSGF